MRSCPDASALDELMNGGLEGDSQLALEEHLGECSACQQTLVELAGNASEWDRWGRLLCDDKERIPPAAGPLPRSALDRMKSALENDTAPEDRSGAEHRPQVPGFDILSELGRGGMAVVYKARQRGLGRLVALKMVLAGKHASADAQVRFRLEAKAVAQLQHPNIVQIFETGEHDGLPYFALELVEGGSLAGRIRGTPQAPEASARLMATVARAVHSAHENRIVHRDLKPGNIMIAEREGSGLGTPRVTDFGLALLLDDEETRTRSGEVMGTPQYMAPEQAQSRREAIGPPTDIYALGAILYELLTGRPPFQAANAVDTLVQVSFDEPVPPTRLQRTLPRDLETICLKCLHKEPRQRYTTALDLAQDLERYLAHEPIRARPVGNLERLRKWARRRPAVASSLVLVLGVTLLAFTGISLALLETRDAQQKEALQRAAAEDATRNANLAYSRSEQGVYLGKIHQARARWLLNNVRTSEQILDSCEPRLRGWEWHYLRGLNHSDLLTVELPGTPFVNALAYSPDGRWLAAGGGNPFGDQQSGILQVCDAATGAVRWRQEDRSFPIWGVAFSPDGKQVASYGGGGRVGELRLWDAATGKLLRDFPRQSKSPGQSVAFSPDGRRLASASFDFAVQVWEVSDGEELFSLRLVNSARKAVFSPDGRYLVTGADDGVRYWDAATGTPVRTVTNSGSLFALSPDGSRLVTASTRGGAARVLDVTDVANRPAALVDVLSGHPGELGSLAFSPDGCCIATAGADSTVRVWRVAGGATPQVTFRGHLGRVAALAFHPDGHQLASAGQQPGEVKVWDMTRPPEYTVAVNLGPERNDVDALTFTAGDGELLVLGVGGLLNRWDADTGRLATDRRIGTEYHLLVPAVRAEFAARGRKLIAASHEDATRINVWDISGTRLLTSFRDHGSRVWHIAVDGSGSQVVSVGHRSKDGKIVREIRSWESATGRLHWSETTVGQRTLALALSADGSRLAEAVLSGTETAVRLSDMRSGPNGSPVLCQTPVGVVRALAFSRDGTRLAGATGNGSVVVWDATTGQPLRDRPLEGSSDMNGLAFSPDGTRLAGVDRSRVWLWDVKSGEVFLHLQGADPRTADNAFNPRVTWSEDGTRIAASNWDRTVSVWDAADAGSAKGKVLLRRQAEQRRYAWHLDQLERNGAEEPDAPAEAFHRRRVMDVDPPIVDLSWRRGDYFARQRHWVRALADYTSQREGASDRLLERSLLLLQTGDQRGYERLMTEALARVGNEQNSQARWELMRCTALAPLPETAATQALTLVKKLRETHPQERAVLDFLGLALLRAGALEEAGDCFRQSLKVDPTELAEVGLALVLLRQGDRKTAQDPLTRIDRWLAEQDKQHPAAIAVSVSWEWQAWLRIHLLRQEAAGVLAGLSADQ